MKKLILIKIVGRTVRRYCGLLLFDKVAAR